MNKLNQLMDCIQQFIDRALTVETQLSKRKKGSCTPYALPTTILKVIQLHNNFYNHFLGLFLY